ncbi:hypothetical protein T310_6736, partial [Rasamsonia emersonii CBS 393.64]
QPFLLRAKVYYRSTSRQVGHVAFPILDPVRIDQTLSLSVELLVCATDGAIADVRHLGNLLGRLAVSHQIGRHVDARSHDRQRRSASKIAHGGDAIRKRHRDVGDLVRQIQQVAKPTAQIARLCRGGRRVRLVRVRNTFTDEKAMFNTCPQMKR